MKRENYYENMKDEEKSDKSQNDNENSDNNSDSSEDNEKDNNKVRDMGSVQTDNSKGSVYSLSIVGQIEGHSILPPQTKTTKYEHVIPQLVSVEEDEKIDALLILLNTVGGDVEAGLAIAEMIASMNKPTVSLVLGGGHSIGVPLAVSTDYSFIVPSATMTIHPIRMNGTVIGVPQMFNYFNKVQDRVTSFVTKHSKISKEDFTRLMMETDEIANDVGTILFGEEPVNYGLIDEVGGISDALRKVYEIVDQKKD